ncbi:MAG: 4-alpha-glucanotransferase [Gallionella sp.]
MQCAAHQNKSDFQKTSKNDTPMLNKRASGILLHPTSLPGRFGSGDLGADAYRFVDWLASAGQTYWQVLPLGEIGPGNSPYMSRSAFAGNLLLIDLAELADHGWLEQGDLEPLPEFHDGLIDFGLTQPFRMDRLRRAANNFFSNNKEMWHEYNSFCEEENNWLRDYALFMAIAEHQEGREWDCWPEALVRRNEQALRSFETKYAAEVGFWKFCQWCFARQWFRLKEYANSRGIRIIGDAPIFVAYQSADVWAHQELFKLDEGGRPTVVAGVPPDYFSETGQLWGNPVYRWETHESTGFAWWIARMRHAFRLADLVRVDHFRGFAAYWEIPADAPNAIGGQWVAAPGEPLFHALKHSFPQLPIIAEDLGIITPDVAALRDKFELPGMRVLQFAFGDNDANPFLPHNYAPNTVAYTGTHDNDTTLGWWSTLSERERTFALQYLSSDGLAIHWDMIRALSASVANTVIFPMQDILGLTCEHRMNFPGKPSGNWEWRFAWDQIKLDQTKELARISVECSRI